MPELPEVETVARGLRAAGVEGRIIHAIRIGWPGAIQGASPARFVRLTRGQRILRVRRRGKYIVFDLPDGAILVHLRMTGRLFLTAPDAPADPYERVALQLDDGRRLRFRDPRKFGRWRWVADAESALAHLGPEPLDPALTRQRFEALLARRSGMLKPLLLNQRVLAGLGNIYVDEALWDAGLHPRRSCAGLDAAERERLYRGVRRVLRGAIAAGGTSLGAAGTNFHDAAGQQGRNRERLRVFRRAGLPCPRCGAAIARIRVAQRGTHYCATCQPIGAA